ncbi:transcriptional repressor [Pseudohalocynthiibacter aestuariivivens]|uniref:Ferric uptake regulation protein n=1 Tax=Roseovarius pelagicus TaxID=2980108 RepID=A0ABY6DFQ7_9RHOB|nr:MULTISPECIES: Fur family transcriptional regulator [Rhodobacterales]QIE46777.1 transcriptional repressor [Pseudohalocynthiibacter aestuariivivens]UXX84684.1 transcriptional repressor [Roseovarius pelagicus]
MRKQGKERQRDILKVLRDRGRPMSAYEVLDALKGKETKLAPPTIYRALSALTGTGAAHKLESMNAFVSCQCDHADHTPVLAICDDCGAVEEHADHAVTERLTQITAATGFDARRHVVEVHGLCGACAA